MTDMPSAGLIPAPAVNSESRPFWEAASRNSFLLPVCGACGSTHWYPRMVCPLCASQDVRWQTASGKGRLYSYSILRRGAQPYVLAYVTLDEGPTMLTNVVECAFEQLRVGLRVEVKFVAAEGGLAVPMFRPCASETPV